jgi:hypothetical protein
MAGAGPTGMDQNAAGGSPASGQDGARQALEQVMGELRELGQRFEALAGKVPSLQPEVQKMRQILKQMVVKAAQQAPQQTASSQGLPMGGG